MRIENRTRIHMVGVSFAYVTSIELHNINQLQATYKIIIYGHIVQ
jgi:hypothetical protein